MKTTDGLGALPGWLVLMALATACAGPQQAEVIPAPVPPSLALEVVQVKGQPISFGAIQVNASMQLVSSEPGNVRLTDCACDFSVDGGAAQRIQAALGVVLGPGQTHRFQVAHELLPNKDPDLALGSQLTFLASDREEIPVSLQVTCGAEGALSGPQVQGSWKGLLPLPRPPKVRISQANAERFGGRQVRLSFEVSILNENHFSFRVKSLRYDVALAETAIHVEGDLTLVEVVDPSHEASFDIATPTLSADEEKGLKELLARGKIEYKLKGQIDLDALQLDLESDGSIEFPHL